MEWLDITSQENQDMSHEFIGNLIMQEGFKVRYTNVEIYSESFRQLVITTFSKHGYNVSITYRNDFAYCEVTAIKRQHKYLDYAMFLAALWAAYRMVVYILS